MAATEAANEPNGRSAQSHDEVDLDERARKRMEVGLSPRRPTAKAAPVRPPDIQTFPVPPAALAFVLLTVLIATIGLLAVNLSGGTPGWWPLRAATLFPGGTSAATPVAALGEGAFTLHLSEDFGAPTSLLLQGEQRQEWRTELLPAESVYRIQVWPNHLAWSLIGLDAVEGYRLQTDAQVSAGAPEGYGGLIVRYQDDRHFHLFAVDGQGRFLIQRQDGDHTDVLQTWTDVPFLNPAGSSNILTLEDKGETLRFYGNGMLLYEVTNPSWGPGYVGLAGGSMGPGVAEVRFDWIQLYQAVESVAAQ